MLVTEPREQQLTGKTAHPERKRQPLLAG